jgi:hypothetical protein
VAQGHPAVARDLLLADFRDPHPPAWWPPDAAPTERLAAVAALLPRPLPTGHLLGEHTLGSVLLRTGAYDEAAHYAAGCFQRTRTTTAALTVARAAAALGDRDVALGWLRAAVDADTDPAGAAHTIDRAPELAAVRSDPQVVLLRQRLDG